MTRVYVDPEVVQAVLERDGGCVLRDEPGHVCMTIFRREHSPFALQMLTMEHVKQALAMGAPRKHDVWLLVALCGFTNNKPSSEAERTVMRKHLAKLYPEQWAGVELEPR